MWPLVNAFHLSGPPHSHQRKEDKNNIYLTRLLGVTVGNRLQRGPVGLLLRICKLLQALHFLCSLICVDVRTEDNLYQGLRLAVCLGFIAPCPFYILVVPGPGLGAIPMPPALSPNCQTTQRAADEDDVDENGNRYPLSSRFTLVH